MAIANTFPVIAVFADQMATMDLMWLFWVENLVAGVVAWLRAAFANGGDRTQALWVLNRIAPLASFPIHYGGFVAIHGFFLYTFEDEGMLGPRLSESLTGIGLAMLAGQVALFVVWLATGEYQTAVPSREVARPYPRMVVLHVMIIAAGFVALGTTLTALQVALGVCAIKIVVDTLFALRTPTNTVGSSVSPKPVR